MSQTKYCLSATEKVNGGLRLVSGMYAKSDGAETAELARQLSRPQSSGPVALVRLDAVSEDIGKPYFETILEFLED